MKKLYRAALISAALLLLVSCQNNESEYAFDSYNHNDLYTLVGSGQEFSYESDVTMQDSVSLILPVRLKGRPASALCDTIILHALDTLADVKVAAGRFIDNARNLSGFPIKPVDKKPESYDINFWFQNVTGYVTLLNEDFLVYRIDKEWYEGGAHGSSYIEYLNYAIDADKVLTYADIFTAKGLSELPDVIRQKALDEDASLNGILSIYSLPEGNNFCLFDNGKITFQYAEYEAGPYSIGNFTVSFYPWELMDYMTDYGRAVFGLENLD